MTEPTITCPSCAAEIRLTESLAAPLIKATRDQFEQQLAAQNAAIAGREQSLQARQNQLAEAERNAKADIAVNVSQALPKGVDNFDNIDGIWLVKVTNQPMTRGAMRALLIRTGSAAELSGPLDAIQELNEALTIGCSNHTSGIPAPSWRSIDRALKPFCHCPNTIAPNPSNSLASSGILTKHNKNAAYRRQHRRAHHDQRRRR